MCKLLVKLIIVGVLFWTEIPVLAQSTAIVDDATLSLPEVSGFEILTGSSPSFLEQDRWTVPSNRLLALYERASKKEDRALQNHRKIAVQSYRKAEKIHVSISEFQALRTQFQISNQSLLDTARINAGMHQTEGRETALEKPVKIEDVHAIEMFNENNDWSISMLTRIDYSMEEKGSIRKVPIILSTTIFLLKGKICFLYIFSPHDTEDSKKWVKAQTIDWLSNAYGENLILHNIRG